MLSGAELGQLAYEDWGRYGVPVFPCNADKRPLLKWKEGSSTDEKTIVETFSRYGAKARHIGAVMGERSGLFAVDFDLYKGEAPKEFLQTLLMGGMLPATRIHQTKSGGLHYIYTTADADKMPRNSAPHEGVEIRGEGGFLIVPPTPGYEILEDNDAVAAPSSLLKRIARSVAAFNSLSISGLKELIIEGKSFHEPLTALSAKLHSQSLPPSEVLKHLTEAMEGSVAANANHERHDRWAKIMKGSDGELARISASAYRKFNPLRDMEDVDQVKKKVAKATRNRGVTLGGFFLDKPKDNEDPKKGVFGKPAATTENVPAPDDFPFPRSYQAPIATDSNEDKRFLIYPLVMESDVIVLSAAPKAGKTLTAMSLCLHAAAGLPVGDALIPMDKEGKTSKVPVIYFALEGQGAIKKRVRAWIMEQRARGTIIDEDSLRLYVVEQSINLAEEASRQDTVDKLLKANAYFKSRGWGEIGIVVFDTLTKAMPGKDQNSVEDTSAVFSVVDMMKEVGISCATFFIHHNNKSGGGPRGSGNIQAEPDTLLTVKKLEPIVDNGAVSDCYELSVFMARAIDDDQKYRFKALSVEIGVNSQGIMEDAPVLDIVDDYEAQPKKMHDSIKKAAGKAKDEFYNAVWTTLSDCSNGYMSFAQLHKTIMDNKSGAGLYYSQHLNGNNKDAAKAAWYALLHQDRLPSNLADMQFEVGAEGVTMSIHLGDAKEG